MKRGSSIKFGSIFCGIIGLLLLIVSFILWNILPPLGIILLIMSVFLMVCGFFFWFYSRAYVCAKQSTISPDYSFNFNSNEAVFYNSKTKKVQFFYKNQPSKIFLLDEIMNIKIIPIEGIKIEENASYNQVVSIEITYKDMIQKSIILKGNYSDCKRMKEILNK